MKEKKNSKLMWFIQFFEEDSSLSTTRALNWIWTVTLCSSILFILIYNTIKTGEAKLPNVDTGYVMLTSAFLAAKVGQRVFGEKDIQSTIIPPIKPNCSNNTEPDINNCQSMTRKRPLPPLPPQ